MNLNDIVKQFEKIGINFNIQENNSIETFEKIGCKNVPNQVKEYYLKYDGCRLSINKIFSLREIEQELQCFMSNFLNSMGIDLEKHNYIPIANDGMGGYYVFDANKLEETIYYLDHEFPERCEQPYYKDFNKLLNEMYKFEVEE